MRKEVERRKRNRYDPVRVGWRAPVRDESLKRFQLGPPPSGRDFRSFFSVPGSHRGMTFQVPLLQMKEARPWAGSKSALLHSRVRFSP